MKKVQINLDLLLPEIPDERDACVKRIIAVMQKRKGIEKAHLIPGTEQDKAKLCFHYDPDVISLERIQNLAQQAGAEVTEQYSHLLVEVRSIKEMMEAGVIENQLKKIPGLTDISVSRNR